MITVSFHNGNVSGDLVRAQKAVFDHFGYTDHLQIHTELSHGEAIDQWLNTRHWDHVAIFDIDCIPLHPRLYDFIRTGELYDGHSLFGIAQSANHLSGEKYVGAPFISFRRKMWEEIGKPSFKETATEDVAGHVSREAQRLGKNLKYLEPIHCEQPRWLLPDGTAFGYGTTYDRFGDERSRVYHAFESRFQHGSTSRFIEKCKEVIDGKG